jgi:uncharacterized membrane protein required for colicin V production
MRKGIGLKIGLPLIPLLLGFVFGLSKGFIREILSLAVIFVGIYGSKWISPIASSMLTGAIFRRTGFG